MEQQQYDRVLASGLRSMVMEGEITLEEALAYREAMQDIGRVAVTSFAEHLKAELLDKGKKPEQTFIDRTVEEFLNTERTPNGQ